VNIHEAYNSGFQTGAPPMRY